MDRLTRIERDLATVAENLATITIESRQLSEHIAKHQKIIQSLTLAELRSHDTAKLGWLVIIAAMIAASTLLVGIQRRHRRDIYPCDLQRGRKAANLLLSAAEC